MSIVRFTQTSISLEGVDMTTNTSRRITSRWSDENEKLTLIFFESAWNIADSVRCGSEI